MSECFVVYNNVNVIVISVNAHLFIAAFTT